MEKEGRTAFGARLVAARKHAGLKQIPAAKAAGMSQGTLAELERDGQGSSYTAQLAALYKVDAHWLATGKGKMLNDDQAGSKAGEELSPATTRTPAENESSIDDIMEIIAAYKVASASDRRSIMSAVRSAAARAMAKKQTV